MKFKGLLKEVFNNAIEPSVSLLLSSHISEFANKNKEQESWHLLSSFIIEGDLEGGNKS